MSYLLVKKKLLGRVLHNFWGHFVVTQTSIPAPKVPGYGTDRL